MRKILYAMAVAVLLLACAKEKIPVQDFGVQTASLTVKTGDSVRFTFSGNPDNLVFYSGEPGHNYEFRNRASAPNDLQIDFRTLVQYGMIRANLQVLVSNDFNGKADTNSVKAATWTDLTDRATFSTGGDQTPSGVLSLKEFTRPEADSALIYVAFRYTDYKKPQGQNRWVVRTFAANNVSEDGVITPLAVMSTAGWIKIDFHNPAFVWSVTSAQLLMPAAGATADDNEDWVISKGFNPWYILRDKGVVLKNISTEIREYSYVYTKPGTYKVVFEGSAVRYNGERRTTREISLTVTP
ncbi:DUF5017 domain-containing protein [Chitinophaga sp. GCM10012297]|uniref:DUF5017 domain-containing protein n=1 Tax=Chitinophaga chungangae TaxID=2821488 RepID=A0ABS3YCG2_9BACT|nr:DUF5017 domain-containing protein [Chitinophaga chungangae]MBO9152155.1 DUF5017 domain-containing protein [Chitinophaga chungangae]